MSSPNLEQPATLKESEKPSNNKLLRESLGDPAASSILRTIAFGQGTGSSNFPQVDFGRGEGDLPGQLFEEPWGSSEKTPPAEDTTLADNERGMRDDSVNPNIMRTEFQKGDPPGKPTDQIDLSRKETALSADQARIKQELDSKYTAVRQGQSTSL